MKRMQPKKKVAEFEGRQGLSLPSSKPVLEDSPAPRMTRAQAEAEGLCRACCAYFGKDGLRKADQCNTISAPPGICPRQAAQGGGRHG